MCAVVAERVSQRAPAAGSASPAKARRLGVGTRLRSPPSSVWLLVRERLPRSPCSAPRSSIILSPTSTKSWSRQGTLAASRWSAPQPRYRDQIVLIEGLDSEKWTARVDPYDGCIYFYNNSTGVRQHQVPVGFADLPAAKQQRKGIHPEMFDDDIDEDNQRDNDTEIEVVDEGSRLERESTVFSAQSEGNQRLEEDGNDMMMHDQGIFSLSN